MSGTVVLRDADLVADHEGADSPVVRACAGGPWLVRGADRVRDADGTEHPTTRPVVAVCACTFSQRLPWCDGTHKVVGPRQLRAPRQQQPRQEDATSSPTKSPTE